MMYIMKPIASDETPNGDEWLYEIKFDGFRCVLHWEKDSIKLTSRNNKDLTANFPEIIAYCQEKGAFLSEALPLKLDGEVVVLNNDYQANFSLLQKRGRLKSKDSIQRALKGRPATFMAFDLLQFKGNSLRHQSFQQRKKQLNELFWNTTRNSRIRLVTAHKNFNQLWQTIYIYKGEGMVAKRKNSIYSAGKKHRDWFKIKNWRTIQGFLTQMDSENGYFTIAVFDQEKVRTIGKCKHGLDSEEMRTLKKIFRTKGHKQETIYTLPPAICASIYTLDLYKDELREPAFKSLLPNHQPTACTLAQLNLDMAMIPTSVELTNTAKFFWPEKEITKGDLLSFIREVSPYMLPFLKDKALTIVRAPDGVQEESFFQKHLPTYAPEFIDFIGTEDGNVMICNTLDSLVWFANHGTIEYHVPFQTMGSEHPNEVVFDLDPPSRDRFDLAIHAAKIIKSLLDDLKLISFVKTSGNKGLQIHVPIPVGSMSYKETAMVTQAIAWTLENAHPGLFTTERLKKNRSGRLYIDYVQHGEDKTLIAPYSPRKTQDATVATPLYWYEVKQGLTPEQFTIENVVERVQMSGCPFAGYDDTGNRQNMDKLLNLIKHRKHE